MGCDTRCQGDSSLSGLSDERCFFIEAKYRRKENKTAEALLTICESLDCNIQDFITRILIKYDETVKQKG